MTKNCKKCKKDLPKNGNVIHCRGCEGRLHFDCSGVTEATWKAKGKGAKETWRCMDCRDLEKFRKMEKEKKDKRREEVSLSENEGDENDEMNESVENTSIILPEMESVMKRVEDLTKTVNFLPKNYDMLKEENKKLKGELNMLRNEVQSLKDKGAMKEKDIGILQKKMSVHEQYDRNKNIEIVGVIKTEKEDLPQIMNKLAKKMKIENFKVDQIDKMHRVPKRDKKSTREESIIVQFKTRTEIDEWINRRKTNIMNDDIREKSGAQKIYINEHLAPQQKYLLWKARVTAKEKGWKFVWVKDGKIFCRKEENRKCYHITGEEEIKEIIKERTEDGYDAEYRDAEEV